MALDPGVVRIVVAALCGLAIGVERQWSGHAVGPAARIGGVRTFTLLGAVAGMAGWLWTLDAQALAAILLAGAVALVVVGYLAVSAKDVDGTTEVAALVTMAAGILAGLEYLALASGITALTCLILVEKSRLHRTVAKLDDGEIRAAARFAVMAAVVLPLLPEGPYGPWGGIRPRLLWILVLFFSGMSFVGYIARRIAGPKIGYAWAGLLGGLVSSTNVTFTFARESALKPDLAPALAFGILASCTVLLARVLAAAAVLNAQLVPALWPYVAAPLAVGLVVLAVGWRRMKGEGRAEEPSNPLHLRSALQMAVLFQAVLFLVHGAREIWGEEGLLASGAVLGLTDLDALTISMARTAQDPSMALVAAQSIAVGLISNSVFKAAVAGALGRGAVRFFVPLGLAGMALGVAAIFVLVR
ncbi:MAG TPA: MgtC/SapB family protein [Candidatus Eisenbacteria bacterium]|nr:MgtC/SapB family protein [Candidatus Eisenbacteria bacterium]